MIEHNLESRLDSLLEISDYVCSELDLDKLIEQIIEKSCLFTDSERGTLFLYDEKTDELYTKFAMGIRGTEIRTKQGIVHHVASTLNPYICNEPYDDPLFDSLWDEQLGFQTHSILSVPVISRYRKLVGVVQVLNKVSSKYSRLDLQLLQAFSGHIGIALSNAVLFKQVNSFGQYQYDLIQNLDNGVITTDLAGEIILVNKKACDILGVNSTSVLNKDIKKVKDKEFQFLWESQVSVLSGNNSLKSGIKVGDGKKEKTFDLNSFPIKNDEGSILGVINILKDLTKENQVRTNLKRYMPDHVIDDVLEDNDLSLFNGKMQNSSILFTDIRNFTSLTESLGPTQIVAFLNQFFDLMVTTVFQNNGIIDKFIGDALMAVFGIPIVDKSDPLRAVNTAIDMFKSLKKFNAFRPEWLKLKIGVGISTGEVISGNIGSGQRLEYTVIGDTVNIAARIQELTKEYEPTILFCENTYCSIKNVHDCRLVDNVTLKGKKDPINIYTICN